ncbi:MraY family glycosyltransferase [Tessaracoccus sp. OH4464_COT-324]|uniref:MraY family glycosyltransferase n=1 Tax=Tessaracoccus sp. OH4464_COT-324 TaxID=2491059 RepID=UPI000F6325AC|nr:MraY family glycosyltransferase [Tessaracoccus sp. OH4464_COT-324]RRD47882.1 undecaprenyl/decaprenyl-phosphate alpha-N-acetylglucosaminyl 1-phosphate transferase [Tessaracoccus sp. OH4464_COT-324]
MREYLLVFLVAVSVTFLFASLFRRLAIKLKMFAVPRVRDMHQLPTPYLGGVAMFFGLVVALFFAVKMPFLGRHPIVEHDAFGVMLASLVICALGVLDDKYDLNAFVKLSGQVLAAGIAVMQGVRVFWLPLPNTVILLDDLTSILLTLLFIVVCTNAVNFVDGLDGLAAGVVAIGSLSFFSYAYILAYEQELVRATTASLLTVATAGICVGFLLHNWHPARMFMGDSGAMLLGLLVAMSTISFTGQLDASLFKTQEQGLLPALLPILVPFAAMLLPLIDLVFAYIRRTLSGKFWFEADRLHLHHRLLARGHSTRSAVLLMYSWTLVLSGGMVLVGLLPSRIVYVALLVVIVGIVIWTLYPRRKAMA